MGVSPTSSFNDPLEKSGSEIERAKEIEEVFSSGKYLTEEQEKPKIYKHICRHLTQWRNVRLDQV